jgi:hypothetical protein
MIEAVEPIRLTEVICTLGAVRIEWAVTHAVHNTPMACMRGTLVVEERSTVDARNYAVDEVRRQTDDKGYLMFWDDDILPRERGAISRMFAAMQQHPEIDILGGVYPTRRDVPEPIVVAERGGSATWDWEDGKLHHVFMVGTGFMMVRMSSFKDFPTPWFDDQHGMSDDFWFADQCRDRGMSIYVDGSVICDQIDLDGKRYIIEAGKPELAHA